MCGILGYREHTSMLTRIQSLGKVVHSKRDIMAEESLCKIEVILN